VRLTFDLEHVMADGTDERLDQLRRVLTLAHDQREKTNQTLLKRLIVRFQPSNKKNTDEKIEPKGAA
jgi:hypothetical protein